MNTKVNAHRSRFRKLSGVRASAFLICLSAVLPASAQEEQTADAADEAANEKRTERTLGLAPAVPQVSALPGGFNPAYGPDAEGAGDWHAQFHGYLNMPLRLGINKRKGIVTTEQYGTVLHAPPVVPEYRDAFSFTGSQPDPYVQLHFAYGNQVVSGNVILRARSAVTGSSFFDAPTRGGISDAFLTFNVPNLVNNSRLLINVGAFTSRYGAMGEYDEGRYGTPLIARTNGVGENIVAQLGLGQWVLELQQGFQGQLDKAPMGIVPGHWNDYADPHVGTSLVHHAHAGLGYRGQATLGAHYMMAWSPDNRANQGLTPDGKIHVLATDLRVSMRRFGHLYLGVAYTDAKDSRSVGNVLEVLNTQGGPGLMRSYFGPDSGGTGELLTVGGQYDLSLATMLYADAFTGKSSDIVVSLFGIQTYVRSPQPEFDSVTKRKFGAEASYSLLSWLAASTRFDHVQQDIDDSDQSFSVVSPRLIFRSDWQSRDQVVLQYSKWFNGTDVVVRDGTPPLPDPSIEPDESVVSLSGTIWW